MVDEKKERRTSHRCFFSIEDGVKGIFAFLDLQKGLLVAHIINLSEGGLGLALSKDKKNKVAKGDRVILTHITGIQGLESLINVDAEIKWILDNPSFEFIAFGCEFFDFPEPMRDAIGTFIDSWSMK
ncbi:MAG: PilZ domain-containing protein [Desulfobacterales bacterium]|nr:PilZ domain-containing protein [Desulfobacterales bacterium]